MVTYIYGWKHSSDKIFLRISALVGIRTFQDYPLEIIFVNLCEMLLTGQMIYERAGVFQVVRYKIRNKSRSVCRFWGYEQVL